MRTLVDSAEPLSVRSQCELLGVARSTLYYESRAESAENLDLMRRLDELHMKHPTYGSRRLQVMLAKDGVEANRKRLMRLLQVMGIEAIHPRGRTSRPGTGHRIYPYQIGRASCRERV